MKGGAGRGHSRLNRERLQQLNRVRVAKRIIPSTSSIIFLRVLKKKKIFKNAVYDVRFSGEQVTVL